MFERKKEIDEARKAVDVSDDRIVKDGARLGGGKGAGNGEEELGVWDDDEEVDGVRGGKKEKGKRGKYKKREQKD